ncbi:MAG TPA: M56 family metallopeptidase, partial [Vicinamibacterales bacterium]|nr:M56 family metallopeptidase [Vicinamibacterales bacterium]
MSALAQALSAALIHFVWQGVLIGALLWICLGALRNCSAAVRYVVCCAALALLVVVPAATAAAFILRAVPTDVRAVPLVASLRTLVAPQPMLSIWMSSGAPSAPWLAQLQWWVLPAWSMGVLVCSVRLALGCTQAFALGRRGDPADESILSMVTDLAIRMGVDRPVRVLMSTLVDGPSVVGWLRPVILLTPATAMGLTISELEAVIAHELAHIKRCDYLVNACQVVAETVFFYHPAVWWTSNRIRLERELCCDDLAIRSCGDPLCYARALTTLERQRINVPAMAMALTRDALLYRIQRLLGVSTEDYGPTRWPVAAALCLVLVCASVTLDWTRLLAQTGADLPRFEVASVKPHKSDDGTFGIMGQPGGRFTATNASLRLLIRTAYQLQDDQIVGGPGWLASDRFDIVAKASEGVPGRPFDFSPAPVGQGPGAMQLMMRALLSERFKLTTHKETRELPIFALMTAKNGEALGS